MNPGNLFGQTPLHLLAASKKTKLLLRFLEVVFDHNKVSEQVLITHSLIGFNPNNQHESNRTFMHILLEKGLITTFEEISKKYIKVLDQKSLDLFK